MNEITKKIDEDFDKEFGVVDDWTSHGETASKIRDFLHSSINTVLDDAVRAIEGRNYFCACKEEKQGYTKAKHDTIQLLNEMKIKI